MITYGVLIAVFARETLPAEAARARVDALGGYDQVARDRRFMPFIGAMILTQMCATLMWVLMAVYAKKNYQVPENLYGLVPMTNALMVVLFQVIVTQLTKRQPPLKMLTVGALFYALGVGSVSLARGMGGFWLSMVIMTLGELIVMPTSSTYAAGLAPADMRGRYMSLYGLTWPVAAGIAPVMGGYLSDTLGPATTWYGGLVAGMLATGWFAALFLRARTGAATAPNRVS
jgi:MFS family permease